MSHKFLGKKTSQKCREASHPLPETTVKTIVFLFLTMALFVQNNVHTVLVGSWDLQSRYTVLFGHKLPTSREAKTANPQKASWQTTSGLSRLSSCIRWWKSLPVYGSFMLHNFNNPPPPPIKINSAHFYLAIIFTKHGSSSL